jgi:hypothetical protein
VFRSSATSSLVAAVLLSAVCAGVRAETRPHYGGTLHVETQADAWQAQDSLGRAGGALVIAESGPSLAVLAAAGRALS